MHIGLVNLEFFIFRKRTNEIRRLLNQSCNYLIVGHAVSQLFIGQHANKSRKDDFDD